MQKAKRPEWLSYQKGNFRIIYDIYDDVLVIEVIAVGDRKDIY